MSLLRPTKYCEKCGAVIQELHTNQNHLPVEMQVCGDTFIGYENHKCINNSTMNNSQAQQAAEEKYPIKDQDEIHIYDDYEYEKYKESQAAKREAFMYGWQSSQTPAATFQDRVKEWLLACFGEEIAKDKVERNHRFLEESLELVQSLGCTISEAHQLVDYVFNRPIGETTQEVGGVIVTLAALCSASDINLQECGEIELARIWTKIDKIREKQAGKPKHSPLPEHTPAALPVVKTKWHKNMDVFIKAWIEKMMVEGGLDRPSTTFPEKPESKFFELISNSWSEQREKWLEEVSPSQLPSPVILAKDIFEKAYSLGYSGGEQNEYHLTECWATYKQTISEFTNIIIDENPVELNFDYSKQPVVRSAEEVLKDWGILYDSLKEQWMRQDIIKAMNKYANQFKGTTPAVTEKE